MNLFRARAFWGRFTCTSELTGSNSPAHFLSRTIYSRDTSETWIMCGCGLVALLVYVLTLAPGVCPGIPAFETSRAIGLLPSLPATSPLWLLIARAITKIPFFDTVLSFNVFSAVCGGLAVAWIFRISKRVIFEFIREAPSVRLVPVADEEQLTTTHQMADASSQLARSDGDAAEHVFATLGGVITAISFAFSAPLWIASTSLHTQPFNLVLVLITVDLLARYHFTGETRACVAAVFLLGLGLVESVDFAILVPFALILVLLAGIRYGHISESFLLLILATGLSGLSINLVLFLTQSCWGQAFTSGLIFNLISGLLHAHETAFVQGLPKIGGALVFLQTTVPILFALVSIRVFFVHQDDVARWKWGITNILISGLSLACLMNLPKTAWALAREGDHLPIIPSLSIAITSGALFVYWCLVATASNRDNPDENNRPSFGVRLLGLGICGLLGVVTLRTLNTNFNDADSRKSAFADRIAESMFAQAGQAQCLMTDGILDLNLFVRSHINKKALYFLPCSTKSDRVKPNTPDHRAPFSLTLPGVPESQKPNPQLFVERWLHSNPKECGQVATVGTPELWQHAGLIPVPNGMLYVGAQERSRIDAKALLARNQEFWHRVSPLLAEDRTLRPELRATQTLVRMHVSRMANDLGVLLESLGEVQGADCSYAESIRLDGQNLCSSLNRYGLRLRNKNLGSPEEVAAHIATLTTQPGFFDTFNITVARCGMLSLQEADTILPAIMLDYRLESKPPENMLRLLDKWLGMSRQIPQNTTPAIAPPPRSADVSPDAKLSQAIAVMLDGQTDKAEKLLRLIVKNQTKHLSAWSLLAEVLMNRGENKEVQDVILPAMKAAVGHGDSTLVEMTEGCLLARTKPSHPTEARACFERVFLKSPTLPAACEQLLHIDKLIGNAAQLESDALKITAKNPYHAEANAILGSIRLSQKRYADAESFLRQSIKSQPTPGALNDLAELLRRQHKTGEAEQQARLAIRIAPDFYQAWDTLGNILLEVGRLGEAYGPLRCALALGPDDPRLYLTLTRLRIKDGHPQEASKILDISKTLLSKATPSVREEHSKLMYSLRSGAATP